ncbi:MULTISPECIES: glycine zipper 2TM domain-containing protein [unclassified Prochlorococcus]|uniref:glycine zipper 2TM domain-containing protein n=1 Tax=unclassified Prochlorococcus TaxID=2627481 RepID=UPI000533ACD1|nr:MULTISPECIES: glycine zipper 2TM domain-containing protein [unclassified Prochlorococcus]KGG15068.1 putative cAMP phosphodiesterases class-II precursor [Prochlorococcus sp. MIT 0602]KGG17340.1 putative cAMP phosphodiesterases class-II precursor [Prochlorococcus sp. MIT 0603]
MKFLLALIFSLSFCANANANESQAGYSRSRTCTRNEYREEYFPGTEESPGYVKSWTETIEVPCSKTHSTTYRGPIPQNVDNNDCTDGKIAGGLLGGAAGAAMSRRDGRWWAIPLGVVAGSAIGCDAAGG